MFWKKEEVLFEWIESKAAAIESIRSLKKNYGFIVFLRVFIISTVLLVILYFIFDYLFPPAIHFNLLNVFLKAWLLGIMMMVIGLLIYPWLSMFDRTRYRITSGNIKILGAGHSPRILKWHDLKGYVLTQSQNIPGQREITLLTDSFPRIIHLPDDYLAEHIIQYFAARLPAFQSVPPLTYPTQLTFLQKCIFGFCTILYSFAMAYLIVFSRVHYFHDNKDEFVPAIFTISALLLGPGTICSICMFRWSFFKNKWFRTYAIFFNFLGLVLLMLFSMILLLWQMKKEGGW